MLADGGLFLLSFHIYEQEEVTEVRGFFNPPGNELTFYYFKVDATEKMVAEAGFRLEDLLIRSPYQDVERRSKRAYFLARKPG